jgi:hypothetical protein
METTTTTEAKPNPLAIKFPDLKPVLDRLQWTHDEVPAGKHAFEVLGESGDTKHIWDKRKEDEVDAARSLFKSLTKKGYRAFHCTGKDGVAGEIMKDFDPDAERMILVPQVAGG